jgi:hypothetical protein
LRLKPQDADPSPSTSFDLHGGEYPQIRLWFKEKKLKDLNAWLKESETSINDISHFKTKLTHTMHARVLIALGGTTRMAHFSMMRWFF